MRQAGAYFQPAHEEIDYTDWNGAVVGRGPGSISREAIPPDPKLPYAELAPLLELGEFARELVARHPSTPVEVMVELASDESEKVQRGLLERKGKGAQLQRLLANSRHEDIRSALARDPELLPECAAILVQDKKAWVRRQLTENAVTGEALLNALARDGDPTVRGAALKSERLSAETLDALADDARADVVDGVAQHWKTPGAALARIAARGLTPVRSKALAARVAAPPELLVRLSEQPELHKLLAANPAIPLAAAKVLAQSKDWEVRGALAQNAGAPAEALDLLMDDKVTVVKMRLAGNKNFTRLADLATDPDPSVRESLAYRYDAPLEVLELLARDENASVRKRAAETLKRIAAKPV